MLLFFAFFPPTQPPQSPGQTVIENGKIKMQAELSKLSSKSVLIPILNRKKEEKQLPNQWVGIKIGCVLGAFLTFTKRI